MNIFEICSDNLLYVEDPEIFHTFQLASLLESYPHYIPLQLLGNQIPFSNPSWPWRSPKFTSTREWVFPHFSTQTWSISHFSCGNGMKTSCQEGFEKGTQDFVAMLESRLTGAGEAGNMVLVGGLCDLIYTS